MNLIAVAALAAALAQSPSNDAVDMPETGAGVQPAAFTLDTPIETLAADPRGLAVLDRELPGLTGHGSYDQFKTMSLKALQPFSGGLITDERLAAVEAALASLSSTNAPREDE